MGANSNNKGMGKTAPTKRDGEKLSYAAPICLGTAGARSLPQRSPAYLSTITLLSPQKIHFKYIYINTYTQVYLSSLCSWVHTHSGTKPSGQCRDTAGTTATS